MMACTVCFATYSSAFARLFAGYILTEIKNRTNSELEAFGTWSFPCARARSFTLAQTSNQEGATGEMS